MPEKKPTGKSEPSMEPGPFNLRIGNGKGEINATSPLENEPEIAHRIATFFGLFGTIELITPHLLTEIIGITAEQAEGVLGELGSYNARVRVIISLLPLIKDDETQQTFKMIADELLWVSSERNKYAHAQYIGMQDGGKVQRMCFKTDSRRDTTVHVITAKVVEAHIDRAKRLAYVMWEALKAQPGLPPKPWQKVRVYDLDTGEIIG